MEERLIELETKLAFQDKTLDELNEVVIRQQQQIERLERAWRVLKAQVEALTGAAAPEERLV